MDPKMSELRPNPSEQPHKPRRHSDPAAHIQVKKTVVLK
jgi:hypothetical protein